MMDKKTALDKAVIGLFQKKGATFLSTLYCSLDIKWVDEDVIPTADIDGVTLRICEPWFMSLSEEMRVTLLAHELWHPSLFHCDPERFKGKDPADWNAACDHAINLMMKKDGYVFDVPHLADPIYEGMTAEQIYEDLQKKPKVPNPFGMDMVPSKDNEKTKQLVIQAANTTKMVDSDGYGSLPGSLKVMIERALNPKLPWENLLQRFVTEISASGFSWRKRNRRYQDFYLPGRESRGSLGHLMIAFDSSYSVTNEQLSVYLGELSKIKDLFNPRLLTLVEFDWGIQNVRKLHRGDSIESLEIKGRGGTDMSEVMDMASKSDAEALIVFSDLDCLAPQDPKIPVLFVCLDNPYGNMPFGKVIHVNSAE